MTLSSFVKFENINRSVEVKKKKKNVYEKSLMLHSRCNNDDTTRERCAEGKQEVELQRHIRETQ